MDFSSRFKKVREHFGISQKEIADLLEVTQKSVSFWESGRNEPQISVLRRLYELYFINPIWLLIGRGKMILDQSDNIDIPQHITTLVNKSCELNTIALTDNLIKFIFENSVKQKLRSYDKSVPFLKYLFWDRYDTLANFRLMMRALKKLKKDDLKNLKIENSKTFLIELIKNYQLSISDHVGYTIQNKDKENTLKWLENTFDDLEAYAILMDIELAIKAFDEAKEWLSINLPILKIKGEEV